MDGVGRLFGIVSLDSSDLKITHSMNYISKSLKNDCRPILVKRQNNQVWVTIGNKLKDILIQERSLVFDRFHRSDLAYISQIEELG